LKHARVLRPPWVRPPVDPEVNPSDDLLPWVKDQIAYGLRYVVVTTVMFGAD
jgi:hypothetical protein